MVLKKTPGKRPKRGHQESDCAGGVFTNPENFDFFGTVVIIDDGGAAPRGGHQGSHGRGDPVVIGLPFSDVSWSFSTISDVEKRSRPRRNAKKDVSRDDQKTNFFCS